MPPLKTIKEILSDFDFLEYSTQKRNLAYQVQYLEFKTNILKSKSVYGAVRACLIRELVIAITNIIEYLLFISLKTIYGRDPKPHKFPHLVGQARANHLISRELARDLNGIDILRNKLHPSKQKVELDINCFTKKQAYNCLDALHLLKDELREFFNNRDIEVEMEEDRCPYEGYSQVLFSDFNCPYCGGYHI